MKKIYPKIVKIQKKLKNIIRVENMINSDRIKNADGFVDLLKGDINKVLKDYFDYKGYPSVTVYKNGNIFSVQILLNAEGIRAFSAIPQER